MAEERPFGREVAVLVVGALIGGGPAILTWWLQLRSQGETAMLDRRLTCLKEYAAACNRTAAAVQKFTAHLELKPTAPPEVALEAEMQGAVVEQLTQMHVANALFGPDLKLSVPLSWSLDLNPADEAALNKAIDRLKKEAAGAPDQCQQEVARIGARLRK